MTHFLRANEVPPDWRCRTLSRPIAAVVCRHERDGKDDVLRIHDGDGGGIVVANLGLPVALVPDRVRVVGPEGEPIRPSTKLWVTLNTIDPYHLVLDTAEP